MSLPSSRKPLRRSRSSIVLALAVAGLATLPAVAGSQSTEAAAAPAAEPPVPQHTVVVRPPGTAPRRRTAPLHPVEKIDLSLRDADLVEVLRSFAVLGGFNLVVDPGVKGTVTVELKDVEWPLALAAILRTHGLAAEIDGRLVGVRPLPGLPPR